MTGLSAAQAARLARSAVLVLSANRFTSQLIRSLLQGFGLRDIAVASDTARALDRLQLDKLDLVLADTGSATFDPFATLAALRLLPDQRQAGIPVMLLTTPSAELPEDAITSLGSIHRLPKPLSQAQLEKAIYKLLLNIDPRQEQTGPRPATMRLTTLLLSGNPYTAQVVRALLLSLGLSDVAVAATASDAEQKLSNAGFDLVIADSGPASFDGLAAVEAIRERAGTPLVTTPVLLLAANPSASLVDRAKAADIKAIATKPLDPDAFADRVRKILTLRQNPA